MRKRSWVVGLLALFLPAIVVGQEPPQRSKQVRSYDGPPLSLDDAVRTTVAQNVDVVALRQQLDGLRLRPGQERSLPPPMLAGQIWQWPVNTVNPWNTGFYMPMITQELPGRGKRQLRAALAEIDVQLAESGVTVREREVTHLVRQTYAELFVAREAIASHLASVDIVRQVADMSQVKYSTGRTSLQEVLKASLELSRLHEDVLMLDEQEQLAAARLNVVLNRPIDAPIGALEEPQEQRLIASLEELRAAALANKPELAVARQQVERTKADLAVARQDYKPDFSVQAGYMIMPHQTDALMVTMGMTWPKAPWSRGKIDRHVQEMAAQIEAAKARQRAAEIEISLMVQTAYVHARTAQERASLLRTTILPQSQHMLEVSRLEYQTDQVDIMVILENDRLVVASQLDYDKALGDFEHALADLELAVGSDITPAMLTGIPTGAAR